MTDLLRVENLYISFGQGARRTDAVCGASLNIGHGESVALVGESGSGKSVTALSILQLLPYPNAHHPSGSITVNGVEVIGTDANTLQSIRGRTISMIFQEPMTSLNPLHSIGKQIGEILLLHKGLRGDLAKQRTLELLESVGISDGVDRLTAFPHELSGGQRQRVMIAMALANEPDLLIADEPTTALDVTIQAQILKLLKSLQQRLNMAMLLITHDLGVVQHMAERVYVMRNGVIVEQGHVKSVFAEPRDDYTVHLLESEPKRKPSTPSPNAPEILRAKDLKVWFPVKTGVFKRTTSHIKAVDGVSLSLKEGQTLGIVGESGSGKTTLGLALLRLQKSKGDIHFNSHDLQNLSPNRLRALRREMQIIFQDPYGSLSPRMSVADLIAEGLKVHGLATSSTQCNAVIQQALQEVELDPDSAHRYPNEFSGGQRQRIAIARAIVLKPKLMVLDEPTSALDVSVQAQIINLLRSLQDRHGLSYIFISHDLKVVRALSDEVMVMRRGQVVEHDRVETIFENPTQRYTRELMTSAYEWSRGRHTD